MNTPRGIIGVITLLVIVGGITSVVRRPNSVGIINAIGSTFRDALATAMGDR